MKRNFKYDIIFIIFAAGILALLHETNNETFINKFAILFVILAYYIGKGVGKGLKEREWKEKTEESENNEE
jgi:hypothetical protein